MLENIIDFFGSTPHLRYVCRICLPICPLLLIKNHINFSYCNIEKIDDIFDASVE